VRSRGGKKCFGIPIPCEPTPFVGLTTQPHCDACDQAHAPDPRAPSAPPPQIVMTRGRRRQVDTSTHFCPNPACAYRDWVGWGNLRTLAAPDTGHGGGMDGPCLELARNAALSRAAVAAASGGRSQQGGRKRHGEVA